GGFAVRQYIKYKSKRMEFLKKVTDVLFFKSLDVCQGVLNAVVDSAEEEQSKEMLLVYYLLMQEGKALDIKVLNNKVNNWAKDQFSIDTNVNVASALEQLMNLQAPSDSEEGKLAIVEKLDNDRYQASSIESAKHIIDYTWDNLFQY
ncbi:MAG: TMEM143 family protein, partial [Gammaproteobacteria bacterium]|nr:TMEM143 family protein [Gammaproteobacteria bacterium]